MSTRPRGKARRNAHPQGKARRERPPTNPPSLAQYNLAQARMHKTTRNPIVIKGNAMAIANAVELEGCRMGERVAIKKAPRLISEEPPVTFMKKNR